ncbi:MAG: rRNA maturation RNase YbeY, partial [Pseudobdellovibrionaceae bacterium]
MDIDIAAENEELWQGVESDWLKAQLERTAQALYQVEKIDIRPCELSVVLADDAHIRELNASYRDKDKPTNILSFPLQEGNEADIYAGPLGDLVLAYETCASEAVEREVSIKEHLSHLLLHGILHLV